MRLSTEQREQRLDIYGRAVDGLINQGYMAVVLEDYEGRRLYGNGVPAVQTNANGVQVGLAIANAVLHKATKDQEDRVLGIDEISNVEPKHQDNMGVDEMVYY